jgi:hypothetical protein
MHGEEFIVKPVLRPIVIVRLVGSNVGSNNVAALVDSGSDHVVAAPWVAQDIGVTPDPTREIPLKIGGAQRRVRFADVTLQLIPPGTSLFEGGYLPDESLEWHAQVGFFTQWGSPPWSLVLGQLEFFDQFTVTLNRESQALAITDVTDFDERYPTPPADPPPPAARHRT